MMYRRRLAPGSPFIVFMLIFAALGMPQVVPAQTPTSPPATEAPPSGFHVVQIGNVQLEDDHSLWLFKVTVDPFTPSLDEPVHVGSFVLSVESGAICYTAGATDSNAIVTATLASQEEPPEGCAATPGICTDSVCTMEDGDTVYLTAGSTLTQSDDARHTYGNVDSDPALLLFAAHVYDDGGAGCAGACP